jgi:hypothetical protein
MRFNLEFSINLCNFLLTGVLKLEVIEVQLQIFVFIHKRVNSFYLFRLRFLQLRSLGIPQVFKGLLLHDPGLLLAVFFD